MSIPQFRGQFQAAAIRQPQVQQHNIHRRSRQSSPRLRQIACLDKAETLQLRIGALGKHRPHQSPVQHVILDQQNPRATLRRGTNHRATADGTGAGLGSPSTSSMVWSSSRTRIGFVR